MDTKKTGWVHRAPILYLNIMDKNHLLRLCGIISLLLLFSCPASAQWQEDYQYGFKIQIPHQWSKNSYMDGSDKVYDFYSPDENAAVQLRAFEAGNNLTIDLLAQVYEDNMLPTGSRKESRVAHTTRNGIPGQQGVYMMYYNGVEVAMSAFFTIQNQKAYVLSAMIPVSMLEQKSVEVKSITQSFTINGIQSHTTQKETKAGLRGLTGGTSMGSKKSGTQQNSNGTNNKGGPVSVSNANDLVYQGQTYRTVKIGNQVWMAENLNVGVMLTKDVYPKDNGIIEKHCLFDLPENCVKYGGFYQFKEMMQYRNLNYDPGNPQITQGICPPGWHLPSDEEWKTLEGMVDSNFGVGNSEWDQENADRGSDIGVKLRSKSGWVMYNDGVNNNGHDTYGFTILPAGSASSYGTYRPLSMGGNEMWGKFWTSTPNGGFLSISRSFGYKSNSFRNITGENNGLSVRCIKN